MKVFFRYNVIKIFISIFIFFAGFIYIPKVLAADYTKVGWWTKGTTNGNTSACQLSGVTNPSKYSIASAYGKFRPAQLPLVNIIRRCNDIYLFYNNGNYDYTYDSTGRAVKNNSSGYTVIPYSDGQNRCPQDTWFDSVTVDNNGNPTSFICREMLYGSQRVKWSDIRTNYLDGRSKEAYATPMNNSRCDSGDHPWCSFNPPGVIMGLNGRGAGFNGILWSYPSVTPSAPTVSLSANPTYIYGSGSSILSWSTTNSPTSISSNFGAWLYGGSRTISPSQGANYYWVTVSNAGGSASASTNVYIYPGYFNVTQGTAECESGRAVNKISWDTSSGAAYYYVYKYNSSGILVGQYYTGATTSYYDYDIAYGDRNYYWARAFNSAGYATWSNNSTSTLNALYCTAPTVSISANPSNILPGGSSTLTWNASNVNHVDISNTSYVYNGGITNFSNQTISVNPTQKTTYTITGSNPCPPQYCTNPVAKSVTVYIATTSGEGGGDVYSGSELKDLSGKIRFDKLSVLSAKNTIEMPGNPPELIWKIPGYPTLQSVTWELTKKRMKKNIDNLKQSAVQIGNPNYSLSSNTWFLDTDSSNPVVNLNREKHPDGRVWLVAGNLTLSNINFSGKGTIIVDGKIDITGDAKYLDESNDMAGIIAANGGTITIFQDAFKVNGAYYTEGLIDIK